MAETSHIPQAAEFELAIPETAAEVRLTLIEGSLRLLTARGLAFEAIAVRVQAHDMAILAAQGMSVPVHSPRFVVSHLGLSLIHFAVSE